MKTTVQIKIIFFSFFAITLIPIEAYCESIQATENIAKERTKHVGQITKVEGKVYYHKNNSARSSLVKSVPKDLFAHDMIRTKRNSRAFLSLSDHSKLVLDENSIVHFNDHNHIAAKDGTILFNIKKQGQLSGFKITTKTAVIGVKGTQFLISTAKDSMNLYMKKGLVNVEAIDGGTFEHHLKQKKSYQDYKKEMLSEFSDYKKKQEQEFIEYVKSINVPANKAISINGNKLETINIPEHIEKQFELLD